MITDEESVIRGLRQCSLGIGCAGCPVMDEYSASTVECKRKLMKAALEVLSVKERPVCTSETCYYKQVYARWCASYDRNRGDTGGK